MKHLTYIDISHSALPRLTSLYSKKSIHLQSRLPISARPSAGRQTAVKPHLGYKAVQTRLRAHLHMHAHTEDAHAGALLHYISCTFSPLARLRLCPDVSDRRSGVLVWLTSFAAFSFCLYLCSRLNLLSGNMFHETRSHASRLRAHHTAHARLMQGPRE